MASGKQEPVRRPMRGIQIKPESFAYFKVVNKYGSVIPVMDAGGRDDPNNPGLGLTDQYTNFIVESTQQASAEKYQIIQTFGEDFIFMFGTQPKLWQISGTLLNTYDFTWANEFWFNYETYLRGTKCVENGARVYFYCDGQLWEGYLIQVNAVRNSNLPNEVKFQLVMFVLRDYVVEGIGQTDFPLYPEKEGDPSGIEGLFASIDAGLQLTGGIMGPPAMGPGAFGTNLAAAMTSGITAGLSYALGMGGGGGPSRGKIRDNWDEYIGPQQPEGYDWQSMLFSLTLRGAAEFGAAMMGVMGGFLQASMSGEWRDIAGLQYPFACGIGSHYGDEP